MASLALYSSVHGGSPELTISLSSSSMRNKCFCAGAGSHARCCEARDTACNCLCTWCFAVNVCLLFFKAGEQHLETNGLLALWYTAICYWGYALCVTFYVVWYAISCCLWLSYRKIAFTSSAICWMSKWPIFCNNGDGLIPGADTVWVMGLLHGRVPYGL